ncbi:MAG: response regulator [Deltaproteobacteria bacterium]|nr:response regulator [Deltaproteobacteria bacterium]
MKKIKVLLVDDEKDFREIMRPVLEVEGWEVIEASCGKEALEKVKQERPNIIILDVMMPTLDGFTICKELKTDEKYKNIPIILLTVKFGKADHERGIEVGADAYITKPFETDELIKQIKSLLQA